MSAKRNIKFLEKREVRKMISSIPSSGDTAHQELINRRDRALLEVLFSTGLRIHECVALKRSVFTRANAGKTLELVIMGKGGRQRCIYLSPVALQTVFRYLAMRMDDDKRLFALTTRQAQNIVNQRGWKAGLDRRITPHQLRHSFATYALQHGANLREVQNLLGHQHMSTTEIYTHITSPQLKALHTKLFGEDE